MKVPYYMQIVIFINKIGSGCYFSLLNYDKSLCDALKSIELDNKYIKVNTQNIDRDFIEPLLLMLSYINLTKL